MRMKLKGLASVEWPLGNPVHLAGPYSLKNQGRHKGSSAAFLQPRVHDCRELPPKLTLGAPSFPKLGTVYKLQPYTYSKGTDLWFSSFEQRRCNLFTEWCLKIRETSYLLSETVCFSDAKIKSLRT